MYPLRNTVYVFFHFPRNEKNTNNVQRTHKIWSNFILNPECPETYQNVVMYPFQILSPFELIKVKIEKNLKRRRKREKKIEIKINNKKYFLKFGCTYRWEFVWLSVVGIIFIALLSHFWWPILMARYFRPPIVNWIVKLFTNRFYLLKKKKKW